MYDTRSFKVFSSRDESEGFEPRLEGVFQTRQEAEAFVECWNTLYDFTQFWVG